ncbi:hypothetical protein BDP27DRAFT_1402808 [Rhodocollybia butyracea]|uniref:Nephrocystin 3-like N-terminal domain-containing protein n=1 Tax=Rhodocollybia butyracea TaxID=206335 RepID=A0A9P5PTY7_9AGAR|nr:hypothetical protein BDP27DRAFT_1402808 [Rhodocollybia butyracea]
MTCKKEEVRKSSSSSIQKQMQSALHMPTIPTSVGTVPPESSIPLKLLPSGSRDTPSQSPLNLAVESETTLGLDIGPERILFGVKGVLKAAKIGLKAAPISGLDVIPSTLLSFIDLYEADSNEENLKALQSSVQDLIDRVIEPMGSSRDISEKMQDRVRELCSKLEDQCNELSRLLNKGTGKNIVHASRNMEQITDTRLAVDTAIRNFSTDTIVQIWITTHETLVKSTLDQLEIAKADYISVWKDECAPNTRVGVRDRLTTHLSNHSNRLVVLQSSPGMGKTAIAKSIAAYYYQQKRLGASFFFDKSGAKRFTNSTELFISTLARQLAEYHPRYRNALFQLLHDDSQLISRSGQDQLSSGLDQLKQLIITPMNTIHEVYPSDLPSLIILDGLDECGDWRALEHLMDLVVELICNLSHFQFLVSSRPEREILDALRNYSSDIPSENLDKVLSDEDILTYIDQRLEKIPSRGSTCWPPPQQDIQECARHCGGIFEIANIRIRLLEMSRGIPLDEAFRKLLKDTRSGFPTYTSEYLRILRNAYIVPYVAPGESLELDKEVLKRFRLVLLKMSTSEAVSALRPISSILSVPDDEAAPIHFYHATARSDEDKEKFFFKDLKGAFLASFCLELMIEAFCPGYLLTFSPIVDYELGLYKGKGNMNMKLAVHLSYAMDHWTEHFPEPKDAPSNLGDIVWNFISTCLVAWFELAAWADMIDEHSHIPQVIQGLEKLSKILRRRDSLDMPSSKRLIALGAVSAALKFIKAKPPGFYNGYSFCQYFRLLSELSRLLVTEYNLSPYRIFASTPKHTSTPMSFFTNVGQGHTPLSTNAHAYPPAHVVQSALSSDGEFVALSFQDGSFRVVHSEHSKLAWTPNLPLEWNSKPVPQFRWIEFAFLNTRVVGEDGDGMVWLIGPDGVLGVFGPLPFPQSDPRAVVSPDGDRIFRVSLDSALWSHSTVLLNVLAGDISVRPLAKPPRLDSISVASHSLGFSHDGTHVGAFSGNHVPLQGSIYLAHVWSVATTAHVGSYHIYQGSRAHLDPSIYAPLQDVGSDVANGTLKFYPPGSLDAHRTSNQSDNPNLCSPLPEFPMLSSFFWKGGQYEHEVKVKVNDEPEVEFRPGSWLSSPKSVIMDESGRVYCSGKPAAYLPMSELGPPQSRQLRYSIHKGRVRALLGPGPTHKLTLSDFEEGVDVSESQSYFEEEAFLFPPILLDLSRKYIWIHSRTRKM